MFNIADMFGKIKEMQEEMKKARERLEVITVEAESGGGMVRVKANANRKILKVTIDPEVIDKNDPEILQDLVTAAVNKALDESEKVAKAEISKISSEFLPNIPGFDPSRFGL